MSITGHPDGPPARAGYSIGDMAGGMFTAIGILGAVIERERSGLGQELDVAMLDAQIALLENPIARYFATGAVPQRIGTRHPLITPFQAFPTADGYIVVAGVKDWTLFCALIEEDALATDERFADNALRTKNHAQLEPLLNAAFTRRTTADWIEILAPACLVGPLHTIADVTQYEQPSPATCSPTSPLPTAPAQSLEQPPEVLPHPRLRRAGRRPDRRPHGRHPPPRTRPHRRQHRPPCRVEGHRHARIPGSRSSRIRKAAPPLLTRREPPAPTGCIQSDEPCHASPIHVRRSSDCRRCVGRHCLQQRRRSRPDADDTSRPTRTPFPGVEEQATFGGILTLDGTPLVADFLGARVVRDGLVTACQDEIPEVTDGVYSITVAAEAEVRGCGAPGAEVLLWAFANDSYVFAAQTSPWPGDGEATSFDATFSSTAPVGASMPVTEFKGRLFDADGAELPGGTVVEAYIGDVLCGVTSLRYGDATEGIYTMMVAGPDAVPGCDIGATINFRVDGIPAGETLTNDPEGEIPDEVNLTQSQ